MRSWKKRRAWRSARRAAFGRFLFSGDDVSKPISSLSGGQRSRVALARLTLEGANLLLLDEPTNHLDIQSQEVLEDVLRSFPGTVLLVTHDRYLVDAVATQVWMIDAEQEELRAYPGNYSDYLAAVQAEQEAQAAAAALAADQPGQRTNRRRTASTAARIVASARLPSSARARLIGSCA